MLLNSLSAVGVAQVVVNESFDIMVSVNAWLGECERERIVSSLTLFTSLRMNCSDQE